MNKTKTPRTYDLDLKINGRTHFDKYLVMLNNSEQLECELTEVTRQRDILRDFAHDICSQLEADIESPDGQALLREVNGILHELRNEQNKDAAD